MVKLEAPREAYQMTKYLTLEAKLLSLSLGTGGIVDNQSTKHVLCDLAEALEHPETSMDHWLAYGAPGSVHDIRQRVLDLVGRGDDMDIDVLRMVTNLRSKVGAVTEIAGRFDVTKAAISQRRSTKLRLVEQLRSEPRSAEHPFVELWRSRAPRCVRIADLPPWMRPFLAEPPVGEPWGTDLDVAHVLIVVALGNPELLLGDEQFGDWLVDRPEATERASTLSVRDYLEGLANQLSGDSFTRFRMREFEDALVEVGVASASVQAVRSLLQHKPLKRTVEHHDSVLVLSHHTSSRGGTVTKLVQQQFDLTLDAAIELVEHAHDRSAASIRADLRKFH